MNWLGMNSTVLSELQNAWNWLEQSRNLFQALGDAESAAKIAMNQGMVAKALGQFTTAERAYAEALDYYQASGNRIWQSHLLNNLGRAAASERKLRSRRKFFRARHPICPGRQLCPHVEAYALTSIGDLYRDICAIEESREAYRQARPVTLRINDRFLLFYLDLAEAVLAHLEKHPEKSQRLLHLAWQATEISGSLYQQNLVRLERGAAWLARRCSGEALTDLREAATSFEHAGHRARTTACELLPGRRGLYRRRKSRKPDQPQSCIRGNQ